MRKLFATRGFVAYVVMLFLNAFVDLGHKIVIQNTVFKMYDGSLQIILTAVVNALILLPYVFLFTPTGYLADKYPKHQVMKYSALAEVITMLLVIAAYYSGWFWCAFALTLAMAIQSAFYSPAKYGYIRELVGDNELAEANGVVQAVTIVAILLGTLVFSAVFEIMLKGLTLDSTATILQAIYPLGILLWVFALGEWLLAFRLPAQRETDTARQFDWAAYGRGHYLKENVEVLRRKPVIGLTIMGLITFWSTSQVVLAVFPAFAKERLAETNTLVIQGILACTGIGIMLGSLLAGKFSRNRIELSLMPLGIIGFALCLGLFPGIHSAWGFALLFIACGILGGFFIVPMNALMQYQADPQEIGTVLAANNWLQNGVMLLFLLVTIALSWWGIHSSELFYILMGAAFIPAVYAVYRLPHSLLRWAYLLQTTLQGRSTVTGFEHLPANGPAIVLVECSDRLDAMRVQLASPRRMRFIQLENTVEMANTGLLLETVPDIAQGINLLQNAVQEGHLVCILYDHQQFTQWLDALPHGLGADIVPAVIAVNANRAEVMIGQALPAAGPAHRVQLALAELSFTHTGHKPEVS